MPDFLTLTCPSCGARLKLADGIGLLVCASCGNEHMVHREGGAIYLAPIAQDVRQIRVSSDKTAAELAIPRLKQGIQTLEAEAKQAEQSSYSSKVPESPNTAFVHVGLAISLIASLVFFADGNMWVAVPCALAFLFFISWLGILSDKRARVANALRETDLSHIKAQLAEKSAALAKNQQIANS